MKYKGYHVDKIYEILDEKTMFCIGHAYSLKEAKRKIDDELKGELV